MNWGRDLMNCNDLGKRLDLPGPLGLFLGPLGSWGDLGGSWRLLVRSWALLARSHGAMLAQLDF